MCGICGFVGQGTPADLRRMTDTLAHRGPDGHGHWSDPERGVHLGHRRLSILDLAGGVQPMVTRDGDLVITFNGEIYNFAELRAELGALGCQFETDHSDTEVLLHGYRMWGSKLPDRLNGMWAFVIYDRARQRLFASRDRFGKKPFYYTTRGGVFAFASELNALRAHPISGSGLSESPAALRKYFGYGYIPAPHTIFEGVHKLPGGHTLWVEIARPTAVQVVRSWSFRLEPTEPTSANALDALSEELRELLSKAVQRRLVADVPVGVFLSGGIDSSAITALAARHVTAGQLRTFSVGFAEPSFDESAFSRQVAERFGTRHQSEILSMHGARELLPEIVRHLDEPLGDSSLIPTYLLSRFTSRSVKVALGGDGGDELFAGYDPFRAVEKARRYQAWVPKPVHEAIAFLAARLPVSHQNMSFDFKLKRTLRGLGQPPSRWLPVWMSPLSPAELNDFFREPVALEEVFSEAIEAWDRMPGANVIDRALQFYTELYLQDDILAKVDRAAMMHGLEVRAPFLDINVVNFARRLPSAWKYRDGQTKYLLKRAFEPLLPREILYRPKKGFGVPIGAWFKEGGLTLDPSETDNPAFAAQALAAHRAGKADQRAFLWNAWLLARWRSTR